MPWHDPPLLRDDSQHMNAFHTGAQSRRQAAPEVTPTSLRAVGAQRPFRARAHIDALVRIVKAKCSADEISHEPVTKKCTR